MEPLWSPDGKKIVFKSLREGNWDILLMNADGSGQTPLTTHPADDWDPAWNPQSDKIAFASLRTGKPEIFVLLLS